jgi:hypothetical protein
MALLRGVSLAVTIALMAMTAYAWGRRLDMSRGGLRHLRKGLSLACASSILLAGVSTLWLGASTRGFNFLFVVSALAGNLLNATSLLYGLRELNGETVSAGLLIVVAQLLWLVFGFLVLRSGGA